MELATIETLDIAVELLSTQFEEHGIALGDEKLREATRVLIREPNRGAVLLARDPEPLGIAVLAYTWTLEHGGLVAWLDELFVIPDRRERGLGLALLRAALAVASKAGCHAVELEVEAEHARAQHLYTREGFHRLARRRWAKRLLA